MRFLERFKRRRTADKAEDVFKKRRSETTLIGGHVIVQGDINCAGNLRLGGRVTGDLKSPGFIFIEKGGSVRGDITCASSIINGSVDGQLNVSGKIELGQSSRVKGDIIAGAIAVERKAFLSGNAVSRFSLFHLFTEKRKEYLE